jgi:hypothetical protein
MRNETQKLEGTGARVAELMHLIGGDENGVARPQGMLAVALQNHTSAFQHEYFMLVCVRVFRRMAAGRNLEKTHRKTRGVIVGTDQAAHATVRSAIGVHRRGSSLFTMDNFHGLSPLG